jgi:3-oxoacyl-[acyl-carrier protein] reductase
MHVDLTGKSALVTGASRGIGRAIAEAMIASGARVAVHYHRERVAADEVAARGAGSVAIAADLGEPDACARLFAEAVKALGSIDVLVNNAGVALESALDEPLDAWCEKWERTLRVNLLAAGVLSREAVAHFRTRGGGRILFVASRAAFQGDTPEYIAYAASKAGMVALARSIARGLGKEGVKAFVLAPGFTRTDMAGDFIRRYGEGYAMKGVALDRFAEPGDIAPMAVLLASGLADHATGASIDINSGSYVR